MPYFYKKFGCIIYDSLITNTTGVIIDTNKMRFEAIGITTLPDTAWQHGNDIDWLRTLALGLLIIKHVVVSFQPWLYMIFFLQNR